MNNKEEELAQRIKQEENLTKELTDALQKAIGGVIEIIAQNPKFQNIPEESLVRVLKMSNQGITQRSFLNSFEKHRKS